MLNEHKRSTIDENSPKNINFIELFTIYCFIGIGLFKNKPMFKIIKLKDMIYEHK
jgi:hypothetical protein